MLAALMDGEKIKHRESLEKDRGGKNHKTRKRPQLKTKNRKRNHNLHVPIQDQILIIHTRDVRRLLAFIFLFKQENCQTKWKTVSLGKIVMSFLLTGDNKN